MHGEHIGCDCVLCVVVIVSWNVRVLTSLLHSPRPCWFILNRYRAMCALTTIEYRSPQPTTVRRRSETAYARETWTLDRILLPNGVSRPTEMRPPIRAARYWNADTQNWTIATFQLYKTSSRAAKPRLIGTFTQTRNGDEDWATFVGDEDFERRDAEAARYVHDNIVQPYGCMWRRRDVLDIA